MKHDVFQDGKVPSKGDFIVIGEHVTLYVYGRLMCPYFNDHQHGDHC